YKRLVKEMKKVLVANRGAIASRIIRACRSEKIKTVAIYSEVDRHLPYVQEADESYEIGKAQVDESYLNSDAIIRLAKQTEADAIHPGYGFLSESTQFVRACEEANITFIGPDANVMEQMGDKVIARKRMQEANVPVIPGSDHAIDSLAEAKEIATTLGFPLLIKATADGSGIGTQKVDHIEDFEQAFTKTK